MKKKVFLTSILAVVFLIGIIGILCTNKKTTEN